MLTSLLVYRFVLANALGVAICLALAWSGHLVPVFETDQSRLTFAIAGLFLVGWAWTLKESISVSGGLNRSKAFGYRPASVADAEKAMLKVEWLESIPEWLVGLEARPESHGQFMLRYEPSLDVRGPQFHPLPPPPLLPPKPMPDAAPHLEQDA